MNTSLALKIEQRLGLEEGYFMILQVYHDIKQEKNKQVTRPDLSKLRSGLFWDTDLSRIDWQRQKRAVMERIFERGNSEEKLEITRFYGDAEVKKYLREKTKHA